MKKEVKRNHSQSVALEHASIGMAVMDAIPVLFFSISIWLIHTLFPSVWFAVGAVLCILAGLGKVHWKLVKAVSGQTVVWLNKQFRVLMPAGFALILLSLVTDGGAVSWDKVWQSISMAPVHILLIIGIVLMGMMMVLAVRMDQSSAKANWIEQCVNLCAQLCVLLAVCVVWYDGQAYLAYDGIDTWLTSGEQVQVQQIEGGYLFDGPGQEAALMFYPGALVEAKAYSPLLYMLAERGMDTIVYDMPLYTALLDMNAADRAMQAYQYQHWYVGGHSLGGLTAAGYAEKNACQVEGLILLAAYPNTALTHSDLPVLSIYGTQDQVLNAERYQKAMANVRGECTEVLIEGGNHAQFAFYGPQKGDGLATITAEEQWQQTVDAICTRFLTDQ